MFFDQIASGYRGRFTGFYISALFNCTSRRHTGLVQISNKRRARLEKRRFLGNVVEGERKSPIGWQLVVAEQTLENSTYLP